MSQALLGLDLCFPGSGGQFSALLDELPGFLGLALPGLCRSLCVACCRLSLGSLSTTFPKVRPGFLDCPSSLLPSLGLLSVPDTLGRFPQRLSAGAPRGLLRRGRGELREELEPCRLRFLGERPALKGLATRRGDRARLERSRDSQQGLLARRVTVFHEDLTGLFGDAARTAPKLRGRLLQPGGVAASTESYRLRALCFLACSQKLAELVGPQSGQHVQRPGNQARLLQATDPLCLLPITLRPDLLGELVPRLRELGQRQPVQGGGVELGTGHLS